MPQFKVTFHYEIVETVEAVDEVEALRKAEVQLTEDEYTFILALVEEI